MMKVNIKSMYIVLLIAISLLTYNCGRQESIKKEFYENGNIKLEYIPQKIDDLTKVIEYSTNGGVRSITYENKNGNLDSVGEYYNEQGNLSSTVTFIDGVKTGIAIWYYPNGEVEEEVYLLNGKRTDKHKYFNKDGSLKQVNFYKIIDNESILNGILRFDRDGKIINDSSEYEEIVLIRDTITQGDSLEFRFIIYNEANIFTRAFIGNFDKNFNLLDSSSLSPLNMKNTNFIIPTQAGVDTLRIIFEVKKLKGDKVFKGKSYLEKQYYVKSVRLE